MAVAGGGFETPYADVPLPGRAPPPAPTPGSHTRHGAIVGNEVGHVHVPAVHLQVPHAPHKVPRLDREALGQVRHPAQQQGPCQIQRPEEQQWW